MPTTGIDVLVPHFRYHTGREDDTRYHNVFLTTPHIFHLPSPAPWKLSRTIPPIPQPTPFPPPPAHSNPFLPTASKPTPACPASPSPTPINKLETGSSLPPAPSAAKSTSTPWATPSPSAPAVSPAPQPALARTSIPNPWAAATYAYPLPLLRLDTPSSCDVRTASSASAPA